MPSLPLIPYTPITDGSVWSTDLANLAFYAPIRDGQTQYLGHTDKIDDSELSDAAGKIKARVATISEGLAPSWTSGLTVAIAGGSLILPTGALLQVPGTTVSVPASATSFIWADVTGAIVVGLQPPAIRRMIARVVTGASGVSTLQDLRQTGLHMVSPFAGSIKVFGGNSAVDKVCTNGEQLLAGEYFFRNFTVPSGVTVTMSGYTRITCSGTFTNNGTIVMQRSSRGGLGFKGTARANATYPGFPGQGLGGGSGVNQSANSIYNYLATALSSGGSGSWTDINSNYLATGELQTPKGGDGGGTLIVESAGDINVTGTITADGEAGQGSTSITLDGSTHNPGTTASITGGGGGSGGLIWLKSLTNVIVSNTATLSVRGGNGGSGHSSATAKTAGGGGGGYIVCNAPNVNTTGAAILLSGGTSNNTGSYGSVPGGSFAGAGGSAGVAGGTGQFLTGGLVPY